MYILFTWKVEVLNSLIIKITAKENDTNDLQCKCTDHSSRSYWNVCKMLFILFSLAIVFIVYCLVFKNNWNVVFVSSTLTKNSSSADTKSFVHLVKKEILSNHCQVVAQYDASNCHNTMGVANWALRPWSKSPKCIISIICLHSTSFTKKVSLWLSEHNGAFEMQTKCDKHNNLHITQSLSAPTFSSKLSPCHVVLKVFNCDISFQDLEKVLTSAKMCIWKFWNEKKSWNFWVELSLITRSVQIGKKQSCYFEDMPEQLTCIIVILKVEQTC